MSKTQWRPGSAGEKEAKEQKIVRPILLIVTSLLVCVQLVIPSQYRDAVKQTSTWLNVIGVGFVAGSCLPVLRAYYAGEEGTMTYAKLWFAMLAIGFLLAGVEAL